MSGTWYHYALSWIIFRTQACFPGRTIQESHVQISRKAFFCITKISAAVSFVCGILNKNKEAVILWIHQQRNYTENTLIIRQKVWLQRTSAPWALKPFWIGIISQWWWNWWRYWWRRVLHFLKYTWSSYHVAFLLRHANTLSQNVCFYPVSNIAISYKAKKQSSHYYKNCFKIPRITTLQYFSSIYKVINFCYPLSVSTFYKFLSDLYRALYFQIRVFK